MFEPIVNAIKGEFAEKAKSELGLDESQIDPTLKCVSGSLVDTVKKQVFDGKLDDVIGLFTGSVPAEMNNPLMNTMSTDMVDSLSSRLGLGASQAQQITNFAVPFAVDQITKKFIESGNTADLGGFATFIGIDKNILKSVSGGLGGFFGNMFGR